MMFYRSIAQEFNNCQSFSCIPSATSVLKTLLILSLLAALVGCKHDDDNGTQPQPQPQPQPQTLQLNDDSYSAIGNTPLEVGVTPAGTIAVMVAGSVLDNDTTTTNAMTVSGVTQGTGAVTINPDGTFYYLPAPGQLGSDSFTYEATDGSNTLTATVTITLNERVWYVDNTAGGSLGTAVSPFSTLIDAQNAAATGDTLYVTGDTSVIGRDQGLTLTQPGIRVTGSGVPLVVDGINLAPAGTVPVITHAAGDVLDISNAANSYVAGLTIDGSGGDGVAIHNSLGVVLEDVSIINSGESAIEGNGATLGLTLNNVIIDQVDLVDSTISDDAIFLYPGVSATLNMQGGMISGVPGNLGDGIVLLNADSTAAVDMSLTVQGVQIANVSQDAIKVDNENGQLDLLIGGGAVAEGNLLSDIGFRGVVIMTDGDPSLLRSNSIVVGNNSITSTHEGIQFRGIDDNTRLTVSDNTITSSAVGVISSTIDLQSDNGATSEARINANTLNGNSVSTLTGLRVRQFDGALFSMEVRNNTLDDFNTGFRFAVRDLTGVNNTRLNTTVTDNVLQNIANPELAMQASNYHDTSQTCLDLRGNSQVADYVVEAFFGTFDLTLASQSTVLAAGVINDTPTDCQLPIF